MSPSDLLNAGDQGVKLPRDRVGRRRAGQAALEVAQRVDPLLAFDGDHAQVEEHERIIGPFAQLAEQDSRVAIELLRPQAPGRHSRYAAR